MNDKLTRPQAIDTALRMWDGGDGWKLAEIRSYLADRGQPVTLTTIKVWVDPEYRERRYASLRPTKRRIDRDRRGVTRFLVLDEDARGRLAEMAVEEDERALTPEILLALRLEDRLGYSAIAAVARRFFGEDDATEDRIRLRLYELGAPKNPNKTRANYRKAAA